ncbi:uncharacterized protein LOC141701678 [Apium graveolens]|uniref:uncharacterized protein LOC141701678 n=1 Tax=Apium graveolens TaxID=4045 RepID=UPI003D7B62D4
MLDDSNQLVKKIKIKVIRSESGRENLIGPSDEVACVMVGDIETTVGEMDIIVEKQPDVNVRDIIMEKSDKPLERISSVHPSLMELQYPIFFLLVKTDTMTEFLMWIMRRRPKKALPHVHMLIWLDGASKRELAANVDKYVSAEISDPLTNPVGYDAIRSVMIHGPCGFAEKPILINQAFQSINDEILASQDLLVKYQCHMNVEICCHARGLKYLFKYCLKGHDRAIVKISSERERTDKAVDCLVDEINQYFDRRYIYASEAAYRIFGFPIHYHSIYVLRLSFHLPGERSCTFSENELLEKVVRREQHKHSQLEGFFILNQSDPNARQYTYDEIPQHYVWNDTDKLWTVRKYGRQIGQLLYTHHSAEELCGGCGKTFVWKMIIYKLRSLGLIILPVASSGIAATLMLGGRTAHSRFKIPIVLDDCSSCAINHDSDIAELIKHTSLIIWDEAPMQHRYAFECLDWSL